MTARPRRRTLPANAEADRGIDDGTRRIAAATAAVDAVVVLACQEWGAAAAVRALAGVLIRNLAHAYGEEEAAAILRGWADQVPVFAAQARLFLMRPAGQA
jgi:hypothetical protein